MLAASWLQMPTFIIEDNWRIASIIQRQFTKNAHTHPQKYKIRSHILKEVNTQISGRELKQNKDQNSVPRWKDSKFYISITKSTDQGIFLAAVQR